MASNYENVIEINQSLDLKLHNRESFNFELIYDRKKFNRNGILLVVFSTLFGGGLGAIIDLVYLYSGITNQYLVLGLGSGIGAVFGIILGIILLIALKTNLVEDFGASYGVGIGTNIFIGAIIGTFFGTIIGSLFGLILKAVDLLVINDYIDVTGFSYPVFGMLIWICLGLNIGVLVGVFASFGYVGTIFGGALSGIIVGAIGMLAIFGPNIVILYGSLAGVVAGSLIALLVRYSINASIGKPDSVSFGCFGSKKEAAATAAVATTATAGAVVATTQTSPTPTDAVAFSAAEEQRGRRSRISGDSSPNCDCGNCDLGGCDSGGDCEGVAIIIMFAVIIILVVMIISFMTWASKKASIRLGDTVKRGALTALGSCFSIFLIIGANVGLTESFHNILFEYNVLIGAGIGLIFAVLIYASLRLSVQNSTISISPNSIEWKDRHTKGNVNFEDILIFEFLREQISEESFTTSYDDYFKFKAVDGNSYQVAINDWKTPDGSSSTDYIHTILRHYVRDALEAKEETRERYYQQIQDLAAQQKLAKEHETFRYLSSETDRITNEMIEKIDKLLVDQTKVSIGWLNSITNIPEELIEEIVVIHLGYPIENGFVLL